MRKIGLVALGIFGMLVTLFGALGVVVGVQDNDNSGLVLGVGVAILGAVLAIIAFKRYLRAN